MLAGWRMKSEAGAQAIFGAGLASGLANAPGMGGLPVATFFAAQGIPAVSVPGDPDRLFRAARRLFRAAHVVARHDQPGHFRGDRCCLFRFWSPGLWAGSRHFLRADPKDFRVVTIGLLMLLAGLGLLKSVL